MRLLSNLLSSGLTIALLGVLTLPAWHAWTASSATGPKAAPAPAAARTLGVYVDPWHVAEWASAVGATPGMVAKFEAFSRDRTVSAFLDEARRQGVREALVSWEPWEPVPARLGTTVQFLPQPGYRNAEIAAGVQDRYLIAFAQGLRGFRGTVWLRYAHEMNGVWYPWSHDPAGYVRAWRHVVGLVRRIAPNARFVWSANPSLYEPIRPWARTLRRYWPGSAWVDAVGSTMISFGGRKTYPVARFVPRLEALRRTYRKPVMLAETNTQAAGRVAWLADLRRMLRARPWVTALVWSQLPSRGTAQMGGKAGRLDWDVTRDPAAAAQLAAIARDGERRPR